jgi:hypothetical protein
MSPFCCCCLLVRHLTERAVVFAAKKASEPKRYAGVTVTLRVVPGTNSRNARRRSDDHDILGQKVLCRKERVCLWGMGR